MKPPTVYLSLQLRCNQPVRASHSRTLLGLHLMSLKSKHNLSKLRKVIDHLARTWLCSSKKLADIISISTLKTVYSARKRLDALRQYICLCIDMIAYPRSVCSQIRNGDIYPGTSTIGALLGAANETFAGSQPATTLHVEDTEDKDDVASLTRVGSCDTGTLENPLHARRPGQ